MSETITTYSVFINSELVGCEDQPLEIALAVFQAAASGGHGVKLFTDRGQAIATCPARDSRALREVEKLRESIVVNQDGVLEER